MAIELTTADNNTLYDIRDTLGVDTMIQAFPDSDLIFVNNNIGYSNGSQQTGTIVNFMPLSRCRNIRLAWEHGGNGPITTLLNGHTLSALKNDGTTIALDLLSQSLSQSAINVFFTELPVTSNTASIRVAGNPGAATCDPSIATDKGYTVVTE
jgi:hypothetical protein